MALKLFVNTVYALRCGAQNRELGTPKIDLKWTLLYWTYLDTKQQSLSKRICCGTELTFGI